MNRATSVRRVCGCAAGLLALSFAALGSLAELQPAPTRSATLPPDPAVRYDTPAIRKRVGALAGKSVEDLIAHLGVRELALNRSSLSGTLRFAV